MFQSKNANNTTTIIQNIRVIAQIFFSGMLILYLVLLIVEELSGGFVSNTFPPDILLLPIVLSGIIFIAIPSDDKITDHKTENHKVIDIVLVLFFSITGFAVVYYKMNSLGITAWVLSIAVGLIILILGVIMLLSDETSEEESGDA